MKYITNFRRYHSLERGIIDEKETIEILRNVFYSKPSKAEKNAFETPESWAKYAFENDDIYYVTFYKEDETPFVSLSYDDHSFDIRYLEKNEEGELKVYLQTSFLRYQLERLVDDIYDPFPNNQVFLSNITLYTDNRFEKSKKTILFDLGEGLMNVEELIFSKKNETYNRIEKSAEVNLSHNYFNAPKHYLDYEHLFNYREILKSEYLDIPIDDKE